MPEPFVLHGEANSGAVAVEAALTLIGLPYQVVETTTGDPNGSPGTPFGQVPALRLPAAAPERPAFLRWMAFVSAQIYAHYWARDFPVRVVQDAAAQAEVKAS